MRFLLRGVVGLIALVVVCLAGVIAFGTGAPPPAWEAGNTIPGIASWDQSEIPKRETVAARDRVPLAFRAYPGVKPAMAVLVHGSTGSGYTMHKIAQALNRTGAWVFSLDMRGHGGSGQKGDISYLGQLDDDLADFMAVANTRVPGASKVLIGFSAGGGFALRIAGGSQRSLFDGYILLAPYVRFDAPMTRPDNNNKWSSAFTPRIIALKMLETVGFHQFEGLTTVAFAVQPNPGPERTSAYSYRLMFNFAPHWDWQSDVRSIDKPTMVITGSKDQFFKADQYGPSMQPLNPRVQARVIDGLNHLDMLALQGSLDAISETFLSMTAQSK